jgi:Rrf2 family protein
MFSESVKHSIQAMIHLAENDGKLIMVNHIAENCEIPKHYLAKLVQTLSKHHLIKSVQGRNGGIQLNKPPSEIKIIDIIHAIEGPPHENEMCIFGLDKCSDQVPCPIHSDWKKMKLQLEDKLFNRNLDDLNKELQKKHKLLQSS